MTVNGTTLESLKLYKDTKSGRFYLKAVYIIENDHDIRRITIPRIAIPVNPGYFDLTHNNGNEYCGEEAFLNGFNGTKLQLEKGKISGISKDAFYAVETVKEKTTKLTVSEIEKRLGYKIEIVSEKESSDD